MCSIAGITNGNSKDVTTMLKAMVHRAPDDIGVFQDNHISLGMGRLSIIDLKSNNLCPFQNEKIILSFNGEIYNYKLIREELKKFGYKFKTTSDTEVLGNAWDKWGKNVLNKIKGMFVFAIYERKTSKLTIARDIPGEKPLYFSKYNDYLIFGSELKTITAFPLFKIGLDYSSIADYLHLDYITLNKTLINNIQKVQPGEYIKYYKKKITNHRYWKFSQKIKNNFSEEKSIICLEKLIEDSVKQRLIADVPVGLFLSGGIDSSLIAYYGKKYASRIESFTIKMDNKSYDESEFASIVSKHLKIKNHILLLKEKDLLESLSDIEEKIDEPLNDPSIIPTHLVSKLAKRYVKVALSGDGADELFSGYSPFKHITIMKILSYLPKFTGKLLYNIFSSFNFTLSYSL